ncbi:uncharacterized protein TBLA_0F03150, partial [Henningerozyma blattae CBS 6284]
MSSPVAVMPAEIKVPHDFTGERKDIIKLHSFLQSLEVQFVVKRVTNDYERICHLAANLYGPALDWFMTFSGNHDVSEMAFDAFKEAFKQAFQGKFDSYDVIQKLSSLTQKDKIEAYVSTFNRYRKLLPPRSLSNDVLINLFIKGLKPNTRKDLRLRTVSSFYEATQLAIRAEHCCYYPGISPLLDDNSTPTVDADGDVIMAISSTPRRVSSRSRYNTTSYHPRNSDDSWREKCRQLCFQNHLCFHCFSSGHVAA